MELKRQIYQELLNWKKENTGKVLELQGARQVGKTYILKKFAKEDFTRAVYINMAEDSGKSFVKFMKELSEWEKGSQRPKHPLHDALKAYEPDFQDTDETIVIIDEIQESSEVYNTIRSLARDFNCYVVVTGSYLGKTLQADFFLPAGDTDKMRMEPLTFAEFANAVLGDNRYADIDLLGSGDANDYDKLHHCYEIYQLIGGYPEVVTSYIQHGDLEKCYRVVEHLMEIFVNESKRYFTDIVDVNIFSKLFHAIAVLMLKEKTGVRDLTAEISKIAYQQESGRVSKVMVNHAISWLQESHIIGYASRSIDCDYKQVKENSRYYFMDMGIAHHFLRITGAAFNEYKGLLAEHFVYLSLVRRIEKGHQIAGYSPWFALYQKTQGELDFYVRSLLDYHNYGIEVKSTDAQARTANALLADKKLDYVYYLKGETQGGVAENGKVLTVPLYLADRISFERGKEQLGI